MIYRNKEAIVASIITALVASVVCLTILQKDRNKNTIMHPFTQCLYVAMNESRNNGQPCSLKEAEDACYHMNKQGCQKNIESEWIS